MSLKWRVSRGPLKRDVSLALTAICQRIFLMLSMSVIRSQRKRTLPASMSTATIMSALESNTINSTKMRTVVKTVKTALTKNTTTSTINLQTNNLEKNVREHPASTTTTSLLTEVDSKEEVAEVLAEELTEVHQEVATKMTEPEIERADPTTTSRERDLFMSCIINTEVALVAKSDIMMTLMCKIREEANSTILRLMEVL